MRRSWGPAPCGGRTADSPEERLLPATSCDQESSTALLDSHVPQLMVGKAHFPTRVGNTSEDYYHS